MSDSSPLCRNGPACFFLAQGGCWFLHPDKEEIVWLDPLEAESGSGSENENESERDTDTETETETDRERWWERYKRPEGERRLFLRRPVHSSLTCSHTKSSTKEEDKVMWRISQLPSELKVLILQQLDLELMLMLELAPGLVREVLRVPREQGLDTWLGRTLAQMDLGLIHVPAKNSLSLTVPRDFEEDSSDNDDEDTNRQLALASLHPGLEPGTYKLRILHEGFDLVLVSRDFLSSSCGPLACFPRAQHGPWSGSFLSRGFSLHTEVRDDLAPGGLGQCQDTWHLALDMGTGDPLARPAFVISLEESWWLRPWRHTRARNYSMDEVALTLREKHGTGLGLGVVTSVPGGQVVAYTISGGDRLSAYDPDGYPHSDEGYYNFSVTRYGYKDQEERTGLIITGSQNDYDMPREWWSDQPFPDQEHYKSPPIPKPSKTPTSKLDRVQSSGHVCLSCTKTSPGSCPNSLKSSTNSCPNSLNSWHTCSLYCRQRWG